MAHSAAPRDLIEKALNLNAVEHSAAQELIADIYPAIIDTAKIDPVDYPNIEITQLEKEKPLLLIHTTKYFLPIITIPLPEDHAKSIRATLSTNACGLD